jgi:YD repeat-containing protein
VTVPHDAADRLTSVTPPGAGAVTYTFDDNGNLTDRGSDHLDWNCTIGS